MFYSRTLHTIVKAIHSRNERGAAETGQEGLSCAFFQENEGKAITATNYTVLLAWRLCPCDEDC